MESLGGKYARVYSSSDQGKEESHPFLELD